MDRLTVLYDGDCSVCGRIAIWLEHAAQRVPLELVDARSPAARERFGAIPWLGAELVVVADDGRAWAGPAAFLVTGWALARWRPLALLAMSELFLPTSLALFAWVSEHRGALGRGALGWLLGVECDGAQCAAKHAPAHAMLPSAYR